MGGGSWRRSWTLTPIPSWPTEALPSSGTCEDKILLVSVFTQKQGEAQRESSCPPYPGHWGLHTG